MFLVLFIADDETNLETVTSPNLEANSFGIFVTNIFFQLFGLSTI